MALPAVPVLAAPLGPSLPRNGPTAPRCSGGQGRLRRRLPRHRGDQVRHQQPLQLVGAQVKGVSGAEHRWRLGRRLLQQVLLRECSAAQHCSAAGPQPPRRARPCAALHDCAPSTAGRRRGCGARSHGRCEAQGGDPRYLPLPWRLLCRRAKPSSTRATRLWQTSSHYPAPAPGAGGCRGGVMAAARQHSGGPAAAAGGPWVAGCPPLPLLLPPPGVPPRSCAVCLAWRLLTRLSAWPARLARPQQRRVVDVQQMRL